MWINEKALNIHALGGHVAFKRLLIALAPLQKWSKLLQQLCCAEPGPSCVQMWPQPLWPQALGRPISLCLSSGTVYPLAMATASAWGGTHGHIPITEQHSRERRAGQEKPWPLNPWQFRAFQLLWGHNSGDCPGKTRMGTPAPQSCGDFGKCQTLCQGGAQDRRERGQLKSQAASMLLRANWTDDGTAGSCICF